MQIKPGDLRLQKLTNQRRAELNCKASQNHLRAQFALVNAFRIFRSLGGSWGRLNEGVLLEE